MNISFFTHTHSNVT